MDRIVTTLQKYRTELKDRDQRFVIAERDVISFKHEKTIVLALLIQLVIAAFSSFLVVGLVGLYDTGSSEIVIGVTGDASNLVTEIDDTDNGYRFVPVLTKESGTQWMADGGVDAILIAERASNGQIDVTYRVMDGGLRTTIALNHLEDIVESLELTQRAELSHRLETSILDFPPVQDERSHYDFTYTVLIPLLILLPVFISGSIVVDTVTEEIERGTMNILRSAPLTLSDIVSAKVWVATLLGPAQSGLWFILLTLNGITVSNIIELLVFTASLSMIVVSVGVGIALLIPKRRHAQLVFSIAVLLVYGLLMVFPEYPLNTIARLSIGHPQPITHISVGLYAALAVLMYAMVRWGVKRYPSILRA